MGKRGEMMQEQVLAILRRREGPLSAYDVLGVLRETNPKIGPPTVYRALGALAEAGRIHRLESMNAYIACQCGRHQHNSILTICDGCGCVEESVAPDLLERLSSILGETGFSPSRHVIEVHGLCAACDTERAPA